MAAQANEQAHPHQYLWGNTRIAPGDVVLDIGACEGAFAARATELGARVVAVEPSNRMASIIRRLFEVRRLDPPRIVAAALGGRAESNATHKSAPLPGYRDGGRT